MKAKDKRAVCFLCRKPIKLGKVRFQGGSKDHPAHKKCLVVVKRSKDGGT